MPQFIPDKHKLQAFWTSQSATIADWPSRLLYHQQWLLSSTVVQVSNPRDHNHNHRLMAEHNDRYRLAVRRGSSKSARRGAESWGCRFCTILATEREKKFSIWSTKFSILSRIPARIRPCSVGCKRKKNFVFRIFLIWSTKWSLFTNFFAQMGSKLRDESNDAN